VFDTIVIGGGVAGLTAALFAARSGCSTLVLVAAIPGGQLATIDRVEDFPGFLDGVAGYELGPTLQEQAASAGAEFRMAEALRLEPLRARTEGSVAKNPQADKAQSSHWSRLPGAWLLATSDGEVQARTVIIAAGSRARELGVPGEERLRGRGVSHCASCDGPLLRGKAVTVVGAGDSGLQEALTLASFASEVLVVHRSEGPTAQEAYLRRVRGASNIRVQAHTVVEEILGEAMVTAVGMRDTATGEEAVLETAAVFIYIGLEPNTAFLRDTIRLDENGCIPTDIWMRTELPGVFAVGDIRSDSASQAITAAGDGATAAIAARRYLENSVWRA
jgi:thioredoxin reductase (NADPH)